MRRERASERVNERTGILVDMPERIARNDFISAAQLSIARR